METYTGGCHCKAVEYTVELDLSQPVIRCNCSHCQIKGLLLSFTTPDKFTLKKGEGNLIEYRFNTERIRHLFCNICGVESFARGNKPDGSEMVGINVRAIDGMDLSGLTIKDFDGRSL